MGRRPRGDGSVFYDAARGCWVGVLDIGRDPVSRRRVRRKVSAATKPECRDKLGELRQEYQKTGNLGRRDITVEHVIRDYLDNLPPTAASPITQAVTRDHGERIIAALGKVRQARLTVAQVEAMLRQLAADGYSTSTISRTRSVGRRAVRRAERDGLAARNVFELADIPRGTLRVSRSMTRDQAATLLRSDLTAWWRAFITIGLMLGLRPGEMLGLRWADVRFSDGVITIRKSLSRSGGRLAPAALKTPSSRRTLAMPKAVALALTALWRAQAADRLRLGALYGPDDLVFCDSAGRARWPQEVTAQFAALCGSAIGARFTPRELRHSFVSLMSDSGVSIEDIADLAGHINPTITKVVYRHVLADKLTAAASVMDDVFRDVSGS